MIPVHLYDGAMQANFLICSFIILFSFGLVNHTSIRAMSRVYRPRHPEHTIFYRILFHYFETFLLEYENRFERHFGRLRPIVQEVIEKYLDCGNPKHKHITPVSGHRGRDR